jgi:ergothioneine biosynthesis protein EgtB
MPDASPVKWHLAHTSWFFETFVLASHSDGYREFDPSFRILFNSYYNAVGDRHPRPQRGLLSRPSRAQVMDYRAHVDAAMLALLGYGPPLPAGVAALVELGTHHEQQHQELILTDVLHLLAHHPSAPAYAAPMPAQPNAAAPCAPLRWVAFDGGLAEIGDDGERFAFDNERPRHRVYLEPFALASRPVTNADVLAFIADGGYRRPELWLSEGWDWVAREGIEAPLYWRHRTGGAWTQFSLRGNRALELAAPACHLSYYEADALARWAGARLPTEAEWERAAREQPIRGNLQEQRVLLPRDAEATGPLAQLYGDVWEWTASAYSPYPGFRVAEGAVGEYNGKFMCNQFVLRGGSFATPCSHLRATYRNFFPAATRWQFTGARLARDA